MKLIINLKLENSQRHYLANFLVSIEIFNKLFQKLLFSLDI